MARDREKLQAWYRQAMLGRIAELRDLRGQVLRGEATVGDEVRKIGQALRGSGATFGFPRLSEAAGLVETSTDAAVLRRLEGLLSILGDLTREERDGLGLAPEWLLHATGLDDPKVPFPDSDIAEAWRVVCGRSGMEPSEVSRRVADYLGIDVADVGARGRAALRLVPEALVTARRVVPLDEDMATITLAAANPTDLETELEVQRLTGRTPVFAVAPPETVDALIDQLYGEIGEAPAVSAGAAPEEISPVGGAPVASGLAEERSSEHAPSEDALSDRAPGDLELPNASTHRSETGEQLGGSAVPPEPDPSDARVLIVDDDESARLLIRAILEKKGWHVVEAKDGFDALEVMRADAAIGLVIVDLNMPRMDGLELIWELRDVGAWEHLPVIVVTGEEDGILETQLLEEGADDYVRKPVDPRLFLARVESTLRRASA